MTQDKQSWASSLFKWIGGRSSQPAAAEPVEADSPAVTQATLALARDLLNEEPSVKRFAVKDREIGRASCRERV